MIYRKVVLPIIKKGMLIEGRVVIALVTEYYLFGVRVGVKIINTPEEMFVDCQMGFIPNMQFSDL